MEIVLTEFLKYMFYFFAAGYGAGSTFLFVKRAIGQ